MKRLFKRALIFLTILLLLAVGGWLWLKNTTITVQDKLIADCALLNEKNIEFPCRMEITKLGALSCEIDVSWIRKNVERIMRAKLPGEGEGTNRYSYRDFSLATDSSGALVLSVHVTHRNYKSMDVPDLSKPFKPRMKTEYFGETKVDADVVVTVKPSFVSGYPQNVTSVAVHKTGSSGLGDLINDALPKIWFSLDRKVHSAQNAANSVPGEELLTWHTDKRAEKITQDVLKRKLLIEEGASFRAEGKDELYLSLRYKFQGGFNTYRELYKAYSEIQALPTVSN